MLDRLKEFFAPLFSPPSEGEDVANLVSERLAHTPSDDEFAQNAAEAKEEYRQGLKDGSIPRPVPSVPFDKDYSKASDDELHNTLTAMMVRPYMYDVFQIESVKDELAARCLRKAIQNSFGPTACQDCD